MREPAVAANVQRLVSLLNILCFCTDLAYAIERDLRP